MIEFDVDMAYCEEDGTLDLVVLHDEVREMEDREYVPKENAPGDTSDGYHTFDELYDHRTGLLMATCNLVMAALTDCDISWDEMQRYVFKSKRHGDGDMYDGFFIVGINCMPDNERPPLWATWHCEAKWWDRFAIPELERAPEYDGHTPKDALERLVHAFSTQEEVR